MLHIKADLVSGNTSFERQHSPPTLASQLSARQKNPLISIDSSNLASSTRYQQKAMRQNDKFLKQRIPLMNQGIQELRDAGLALRNRNLILNNRERQIEEYLHLMQDNFPSNDSSRDNMDKRTFERLLQDDAHFVENKKVFMEQPKVHSRKAQRPPRLRNESGYDRREKMRRVLRFQPSLFKSISTNTSPMISARKNSGGLQEEEEEEDIEEKDKEFVRAEKLKEEKEFVPKYVKIAKSSGGILTLKVAQKYPTSSAHLKGYLSHLFEETQRTMRDRKELQEDFKRRMKEEAMKIMKPHLREEEQQRAPYSEKECFTSSYDYKKSNIKRAKKKEADGGQMLSTLQPTLFKLPSELNRISRERVSVKLQQHNLKVLRKSMKKTQDQSDDECKVIPEKPRVQEQSKVEVAVKEEDQQGEKRTPFEGYLEQSQTYKRMIKLSSEPLRLFKNTKVVEGLSLSGCSSVCYESNSSHSSLPRDVPVNRFPASKDFQ